MLLENGEFAGKIFNAPSTSAQGADFTVFFVVSF